MAKALAFTLNRISKKETLLLYEMSMRQKCFYNIDRCISLKGRRRVKESQDATPQKAIGESHKKNNLSRVGRWDYDSIREKQCNAKFSFDGLELNKDHN